MELKSSNQIFHERLEIGKCGEQIIGNILMKQGFVIQPLYQFDPSKTPKLFSETDEFDAPDFIAFGKNKVIFPESKLKNQWVDMKYSVDENQLETGFDLKSWIQYRKLYERTGIEIHVFFIQQEQEPIGIYKLVINKELLSNMKENVDYRRDPKNEMIYFNFDILQGVDGAWDYDDYTAIRDYTKQTLKQVINKKRMGKI